MVSLNEFLWGKNWATRTDIPFETDFKGNVYPNPKYKGKEMNEVIAEDQELVHTLNTDELPTHVVQDEVRDEPEVEGEGTVDQ